jgi:hypothetical protein
MKKKNGGTIVLGYLRECRHFIHDFLKQEILFVRKSHVAFLIEPLLLLHRNCRHHIFCLTIDARTGCHVAVCFFFR